MNTPCDPLAEHRPKLLGLAYRMLGSRADAEDILQETYIRFAAAENVRNSEAFLVTTLTRLCLDQLKSARSRREVYVGPWLPEPVSDVEDLSLQSKTELADDLSFALLLALERLKPTERAVFILHDVFGKPYEEIAATLEKQAPACRQIGSRARKALRAAKLSQSVPAETHSRLLQGFVDAVESGDVEGLTSLLKADAVAVSDGGGVKLSALRPIRSADKIARFYVSIAGKQMAAGGQFELRRASINGRPGLLVYIDNQLDLTLSFDVEDERIAMIYSVRNPEKLTAIKYAH